MRSNVTGRYAKLRVNGQVIVIDVNGKEETATLAKDKLVVVKTQEGSQYVVDGATNTIYTSANSGQKSAGGTPAGNITTASEAGKGNTPQFNLSFLPHTLQKYGYDIPSDKSPAENYESTNITGQPTLVPWKSLEAGRTEYVMAGITGGPADSIRYYRESNNMVMTAPGTSSNVLNGKTAPGQEFKQLLLTGTVENTTDKLFAWYPSDNDDTTKTYSRILAGQLNMASYEKKTIQVVLVPVNKSICPDPLYVEKELNRIYQSAVIDWNVTQMAAIDATFAGPVFDNTSPKEHLDYTPDMERVINQFKSSDAYSRDKIYLFFLDNAKDPNIKGFMPFKKQFGFIFKYQQYPDEYMRTIAHELGHGALRLWHTFSSNNQYIQPEGSTNNLMDYVDRSKADSAILLNKYQWDWAHDPTWRIYAFEDQEEAEDINQYFFGGREEIIAYLRNYKTDIIHDVKIQKTINGSFAIMVLQKHLNRAILDYQEDIARLVKHLKIINNISNDPTVLEMKSIFKNNLSLRGKQELLLIQSNTKFKDFLTINGIKENKEIQRLVKLKNNRASAFYMDKRIMQIVQNCKEKDLEKLINSSDNFGIAIIGTNSSNLLQSSANSLSYGMKIKNTLKMVAGDAVDLAIGLNKVANGERLSPADLVFFIPLASELIDIMLDQSVGAIISSQWEIGLPYSIIKDWNKHCGNYNLTANDIFFQYTSIHKNQNIRNSDVMGTSILILDKDLAFEIFGFVPKYLNYNSSAGIIKNQFKFIAQTSEIIW